MRALCLSTGGSAGAWAVGAVKYLMQDLGYQYDIFTGVSVGALNAAVLAQYSKEDQYAGFNTLYNLWYNIQDSTVKKNWCPFNVLTGLWKDSVYNSAPLQSLVNTTISLYKIRESGNQIAVSATAMPTGKHTVFTQNDGYFLDGVLSSSAFPMGLCPIVINGTKFTDGGVLHSVNITSAIQMGATDIDVVLCSPKDPTKPFSDVDTITYGMRCLDYMMGQLMNNDLQMAFMYNKLVKAGVQPDKRFVNIKVIQPSADLGNSTLTFSTTISRQLLIQGYNDAPKLYG